jgi:DNA-binding CsgD family transcriptional regulator
MTDREYDLPRFIHPALCAQADPELWLPEQGGHSSAAKRICARCEAFEECLTYALEHQLDQPGDGVWGGTTPRERRRMRLVSGDAAKDRMAKRDAEIFALRAQGMTHQKIADRLGIPRTTVSAVFYRNTGKAGAA